MQGIYLHIPFCRQACTYCNFHFTTSLRYRSEMIEAICTEIRLWVRHNPLPQNFSVGSVYMGGGTPSLLQEQELALLLDTVFACFPVDPSAEITLEANPDDISLAQLGVWKKIGINRLSVGLQSFSDEELRWMNRAHDAHASEKCLQLIPDAGFVNYSIDLIYGSPWLSDRQWEEHLSKIAKHKVPHVSCYALTMESGTLLHRRVQKGIHPPPLQERQAAQFLLLMERMRSWGYRHYEISNFCQPGMLARHNSAYWQNSPYTGFGPSAHSYDGQRRRWNLSDNRSYIKALENGMLPPAEEEVLTDVQRVNEYIMLALRTDRGMAKTELSKMLDADRLRMLEQGIADWVAAGKMVGDESRYLLTDDGKLFADGIAADLFFGEST